MLIEQLVYKHYSQLIWWADKRDYPGCREWAAGPLGNPVNWLPYTWELAPCSTSSR